MILFIVYYITELITSKLHTPWAKSFCLFRACLKHLRKLSNITFSIKFSDSISPALYGNAKKWAGLMPLRLYLLSREPSRSNS